MFRRALISVSDKSGLEELVVGLLKVAPDCEFLSTGGTAKKLRECGVVPVVSRLVLQGQAHAFFHTPEYYKLKVSATETFLGECGYLEPVAPRAVEVLVAEGVAYSSKSL